jgi:hypothetical protein
MCTGEANCCGRRTGSGRCGESVDRRGMSSGKWFSLWHPSILTVTETRILLHTPSAPTSRPPPSRHNSPPRTPHFPTKRPEPDTKSHDPTSTTSSFSTLRASVSTSTSTDLPQLPSKQHPPLLHALLLARPRRSPTPRRNQRDSHKHRPSREPIRRRRRLRHRPTRTLRQTRQRPRTHPTPRE